MPGFVPACRLEHPETSRAPALARVAARLGLAAGLAFAAFVFPGFAAGTASAGPCDPPANAIVCENSKPGTPESVWQVSNDDTIQGFATEMSVDRGQTVHFKIKTNASAYKIYIYRLGYYGGDGARQVALFNPSVSLPQSQPACLRDTSVGLVDCGNWRESASWTVPSDAVSGIYLARLERTDTGGDSNIVFVVRDDSSHSDLVFQTSDTTWQAYNTYGGDSLYGAADTDAGRSYKVSYNRPIEFARPSYLFNAEYPMVRWLEANGYDVSYSSGVDTARRGSLLLNHKVFLSVGHDEYWSGEQRANVEAARAAGVNLAFFSGNEVFWKTRWESSIDGSSTPYRTLVSYKETRANAKIDPTPTWTGSWRDPRFSPPSDGGRPENALTGTLFTVNEPRNDPMTVPAAEGKLRFWRNTSVANLAPGTSATLPTGVLGYEWDEDVDNGFRPPGLVRLSSSTFSVTTKLLDYGSTYGNGTATHSLTLYRAPSGALVFGAGTVQWAWGLDSHHDFPGTPVDQRMRQATVNLLADMGTQPGSLDAGLVAATRSTDTTPPSSTITSPAAGSSVRSGDVVTITGTAADAGGGVVGGVEVSLDGGSTWHPATGRANWSYTWNVGSYGSVKLMSRAADDSGNLEATPASATVSVDCPCSLWSTGTLPAIASANDTSALELGVKFRVDQDGTIAGIRFYKGPANTGTHAGSLWASDGTLLGRVTFTGETATGWQEARFATPVEVESNTTYVASYRAPSGGYALTRPYFDVGYDNGLLHAPASAAVAGGNGVFASAGSGPTFPTATYGASNYSVDVVYTPFPPDVTPPTVTSVSPGGGATGVSTTAEVTASFSEAMDASTITSSTVVIRNGSGAQVPSAVTYDRVTRMVILDPASPFAGSSPFTVTIKGGPGGVTDKHGNPLASDRTWSFQTASGPVCPCSLWTRLTTKPTVASSGESAPLEVGVKFRSDADGTVTGVRFYKGIGNTGTHVGSLWASDGTLLAQATFKQETSEGWQQVDFASPVAILAGQTYVVSYFLPNGNFPVDRNYFATAYDSGFLHAPSNAVIAGGNGVYAYGSAPKFPSSSYQGSNYWVDLVFVPDPADTTPPTIISTSPANGATGVSTTTDVQAVFSEPMDASTITGSTVFLRNGAGGSVPATVRYDASTRTVSLDPGGGLGASTTYTVTVKGGTNGVADRHGVALASDATWTFATGSGPACPCSLWKASATPATTSSGEPASLELGVRFSSDVDGTVSGIRFYKGSGNTGTHVGSLWASDGTLLARATFSGESSGGWQQVNFATPVTVTAGTTYVASYFAPNGNFAIDRNYFGSTYDSGFLHAPAGGNGVYAYGSAPTFPSSSYGASNYWVDLVFVPAPPDTTPPTVTAVSPADGATAASTTAPLEATFSEAMNASTVTGSTVTLRDAGGQLVSASVTYDAGARKALLDPGAGLTPQTTYTATVKGGSGGVKDRAGNALASDRVWSFTTGSGPACPCSLWKASATPATASSGEAASLELGVKFRSDVNGTVSGIRFYKGSGNTGTHVGSLWASDGTLLARATFSGESSGGWQQVNFATPVTVTAGTTYVASYFAPNGNFAIDRNYFGSTYDSGFLHAPAGGNGVYAYGSAPTFPSSSYQASNYWVDVVFSPNGG